MLSFYNLYDRADFEAELGPLCREKGLACSPASYLSEGFTPVNTGRLTIWPGTLGGRLSKKYLDSRGWRVLAALGQITEQ